MRTKTKRVFLKNINSIIEDIADMICAKENKKAFIEKAKKLQQVAQVFNAEFIEEKIHNDIGVKMKDFATKKDIDSLETKLNTKIDRLETKVDRLETKVDRLETKVDSLETKLNTKIDKKITKMTVTLIIVTITTCSLMTTFLSIFLSINK